MTTNDVIFTHRLYLRSADDDTIDCAKHNLTSQLRREHEKLLFKSLDTGFIHGHIHDWSCKK